MSATVDVQAVEPVDWATHWRRHFSPLQFGDLWVVPSWLDAPEGAQHILRIDPSNAFGTGSHETTSLCTERIVAGPLPEVVLDIGTGTGILAMAALLFGAQRAVGTDNDPDALVVARENAEKNGLGDRLTLTGDGPETLGRFELVVANILAGPLITHAPQVAEATAGTLLLSGILGTQADDVIAAYKTQGLTFVKRTDRGEWVLLEFAGPSGT